MAQKSYFTHSGESTPGRSTKTAEVVHMLRRAASSLGSDYDHHAKTINHVANQLEGSASGKAGVKEKIAHADRKGAPRD